MDNTELLKRIAKESGVPIEDIAAVYTDSRKGERIIFKNNILVNQLQKEVPNINNSFDKVYLTEFKKMSSDLSEITPLLYIGHKEAIQDDDKLLISCGYLLKNASNTVISSVQMLRCGFRLQSGILLRSVVEICAMVIHLLSHPKLLNEFKRDNIKSSKSISFAEKKLPIFGKIWGLLSNKHIHINSLHGEWYPLKEYKNKEEISAEVTIGIIGVVIMILRINIELTFFKHVNECLYWKLVGNGKLEFIPPSEDNVNWIEKKLKNK